MSKLNKSSKIKLLQEYEFRNPRRLFWDIPAGAVAGTFAYKMNVNNSTFVDTNKTNTVNPTIITNANLSLTGASCKDQQQILGTAFTCTIPLIGSTAYAEPVGGVSLFTTQGSNNTSTNAGTDNCTVNGTNLECTNISTTAESGSSFSLGQASLRSRIGGLAATDQTVSSVIFVSNLGSSSLASLTFSCTTAAVNTSTSCSFTLPANITLPTDFSIQIGANGTPSTACTVVSQLVTCTGVANGNSAGDKDIYGKIGSDPIVNTGEKTQVLGVSGADTDQDGIIDSLEVTNGTNPFVADTDGDGIPDGWEVNYGLDPKLSTDAVLDKDGDGLTNLQEFIVGTDPTKANSNSTVTTTKDESTNTITDDKEDVDGDGVTNKDEFIVGTDPKNANSDGDTVNDGDEIALGTDPKSNTNKPTDLADIDGDGITTADENKGPNNGDANGDSIKDYKQKNIVSIKDPNSAAIAVIESSDTCPISISGYTTEKKLGDDSGFDYPNGLVNYTLNCGFSTIKISWYNVDMNSTYALRKYGPETPGGNAKTFYDHPATISKSEIAGTPVIQAIFKLTDGQKGDATVVDGKIVDPAGLAVLTKPTAATLIRTGGFAIAGLIGLLSVIGTTFWLVSKKVKTKKE